MFLYYLRHGMNFHRCKKQIFKSFSCTKIRNNSKWNKASRNEVMQPTTSNNDSLPILPYHVRNQAGFDNPFINGRGFIYLGISKMNSTFQVFTTVQGSVSKRQLERLIFDYMPIIVGSWKSCFKTLNLNASETKTNVLPK